MRRWQSGRLRQVVTLLRKARWFESITAHQKWLILRLAPQAVSKAVVTRQTVNSSMLLSTAWIMLKLALQAVLKAVVTRQTVNSSMLS